MEHEPSNRDGVLSFLEPFGFNEIRGAGRLCTRYRGSRNVLDGAVGFLGGWLLDGVLGFFFFGS